MRTSTSTFKLSSLLLLTIGLTQFNAAAQTNASTPYDYGTVVNGFQDNFTNSIRDPGWVVINVSNVDTYVQTNGVLRVSSPTNAQNPNHLIYNPNGVSYNGTNQEVLVRLRAVNFQWSDANQGSQMFGIGVACQPTNSPPSGTGNLGGYNWMFMDLDGWDDTGDPNYATFPTAVQAYQARLLDDYVAWGPGVTFVWTTNQWYWMRLETDGASLNGKIWPDDGMTSEPTNWDMSWTSGGYDFGGYTDAGYDAFPSGRTGFGGIVGSDLAGIEFEVDYFLLKADGLPSITVNPTANPLYYTSQPQNSTNAVGTKATFSVTVSNLAAVTYQWSSAPSGSTTFTPITGATNSSYTTPALTVANNGTQYSVLVSEGALSDNSQVATVTIDSTPPTLIYAMSLGSATQVVLQFSKSVQVPGNTSGFSATGLSFSGVAGGTLPSQLVLASSAMTLGTAYTLHASGVKDLAGNSLAATNLAMSQALQMPAEFGTTVNGYQDDFTGASLSSNWVASPSDPAVLAQFTQANGLLTFVTDTNTTLYDPEHLLYEPGTAYDSSNQEVLARIRINNAYIPNTGVRLGVGALCDPASTTPGHGANAAFCYFSGQGIQPNATIDGVGQPIVNAGFLPQLGQWYWLRAQCTLGSNVAVKFWPADGVTAEPAIFQQTNTFKASANTPLYAGILGASVNAVENFDVDYILIEAAGLPSISVTPPSSLGFGPYIYFTEQPVGVTVAAETPFTLTVAVTGSGTLTYQWQSAPPGSSAFSNITGQTSTNLTESLATAQSGTQFRCVASVPGLSLDSAAATIVTGPPILLSAQTLGNPTNVTLTFNRAMLTPGSASGFTFDHGVTASAVAAGVSSDVLVLTTSPLSLGTTYTLTVSGVKDAFGNTMASTNITVDFTVELPEDYGQPVAGFQDNFSAATMDTNWVPTGLDAQNSYDLFQQTGDGLLHVSSPPNIADSNPNRLLYNPPTAYSSNIQEVLIRMRVTAFAPSDVASSDGLDSIGGVTLANNINQASGGGAGGMDWLLADCTASGGFTGILGYQVAFLDDWAAWGKGATYNWTTNTWYWLREFQNGTNTTRGPNVFGKVWLADGTTPEPAAWQAAWSRGDRNGLAGIEAASINNVGENSLFNFDVSYFLLKADGLPTITVAPSSFTLIPPPSLLQFTAIQSSGTKVVLQWTGAGTLQQASSLAGPWADLVDTNGAFSPYTIPATAPEKFYRMRQ